MILSVVSAIENGIRMRRKITNEEIMMSNEMKIGNVKKDVWIERGNEKNIFGD